MVNKSCKNIYNGAHPSLTTFRTRLKTFLFTEYNPDIRLI